MLLRHTLLIKARIQIKAASALKLASLGWLAYAFKQRSARTAGQRLRQTHQLGAHAPERLGQGIVLGFGAGFG